MGWPALEFALDENLVKALRDLLRTCVGFRVPARILELSGVSGRDEGCMFGLVGLLSRLDVPANAWMRLEISFDTLRFSGDGASLASATAPLGR